MPNRTCRKCGIEKPLTLAFFNKPQGYWRRVCMVCMAANTARNYAEKPELKVENRRRYNENKANAEGVCTPHDIAVIRETQRDECFYCGIDLHGGGEKDHKTPLSKGGSNWPANMALACRSCNRDKHNKSAYEFFQWRKLRGLPVNMRKVTVTRGKPRT